jgi:hypothetical protein
MHVVTARFDEEEALADPWAKVEMDLCFLLRHHGIMLHRVLYLRKGRHVYSIDHERMHDTHTHTRTHICTYIYIYIYVCI